MIYGLLLAGILAGFLYQAYVKKEMAQALKQPSGSPETAGEMVARWIERVEGKKAVFAVTEAPGADHYQPETGMLVLSRTIARSKSIGAISTAAHEMGHLDQDHAGSGLMAFHSAIRPAMNGCSAFSWIVLLVGEAAHWDLLRLLGGIMIVCTLIYAGLSFFLETDAGERGISRLREDGICTATEEKKVRRIMAVSAGSYLLSALSNSIRLLGKVVSVIFRQGSGQER
ncbi:MAG: zinc metallopeptidase [Clostridia bacterium]|nr:zinc metallopeptidase [Clostridia bacterium]